MTSIIGVLYYGKTCTHSQELLRNIAKQGISDKLRFVPVDQREQRGTQLLAVLDNGSRVLIPDGVKSVPALLDIRDKHVYLGPEVGRRLAAEAERAARIATGAEKEPMAFSDINTGDSSTFSFIGDDPDALLARGSGGTEIPSLFAGATDTVRIGTAPEDGGVAGDIGSDLEALMARRAAEVPQGAGGPPPGAQLPPPQKV